VPVRAVTSSDPGLAAGVAALPYVDEHAISIDVDDPLRVWGALGVVIERGWRAPGLVTRLLRAEPAGRSGDPLVAGSTLPGFVVATAEPGRELILRGRHRFSSYALIFHLSLDGRRTRLGAETRASFPGTDGRVYRLLVIGTRAHVVIVRALLHATRRRAQRREDR
jgi:hypothetical protein